MRSVLTAIQSRLKTRQICHQGKPYLERSYVGTLLGIRVYLHRFVASDEDGLHDHPFRWSFSLLLRGWYWEERWRVRRRVRWCNLIGPSDFHRVVLPDNGRDVWTLFFHTARRQPWGFMRPNGKETHGACYEYVAVSKANDPAFSDWSNDVSGAELRRRSDAFAIPRGKNAYAIGLLPHPDHAG